MDKNKPKALLYMRESPNPLQDNTSHFKVFNFARQEQILEDMCKDKGYEIAERIKHIGGDSPVTDGMVDKIKTTVKEKDIDVIAVASFDRLGRRIDEIIDLFDWLKENGVKLESVDAGMEEIEAGLDIARQVLADGNPDAEDMSEDSDETMDMTM